MPITNRKKAAMPLTKGPIKTLEIKKRPPNSGLSLLAPSLMWSSDSGHQLKAVNCHNEVDYDNKSTKSKDLFSRI